MNFKEGKLYRCHKYYLLIYPTAARAATERWAATESAEAKYWSNKFKDIVRYSEPNEIFIFLKEEMFRGKKYLNVLFGDKQGWIMYEDWLRIRKAENKWKEYFVLGNGQS